MQTYLNLHGGNSVREYLSRRMDHYIWFFKTKFTRGLLGRYPARRIARQLKSLIGCHRDKDVAVFTCPRELAGMAQHLYGPAWNVPSPLALPATPCRTQTENTAVTACHIS